MKQKINLRLILIAILAVITTTIGITFVCYNIFQRQVKQDLRLHAQLLKDASVAELVEKNSIQPSVEMRITWIDTDGTVLFDNDNEADMLANHSDRPEIEEALMYGEGESVRESNTMGMRTFYYAVLLSDGTILRVSTEARSMFSVFLTAFPVIGLVCVLIVFLCVLISHLLTKQLIMPIEELARNLENTSTTTTYKELVPFVNMIRNQHENILASAKVRQDFTANVSHELKTPLTAISGYAELIENQMVDEDKQRKFAGDIRKNADRLVNLINDIIRLSELDQSETRSDFSEQDLYEVAAERVELLEANAREKNIELSLTGHSVRLMSNRGMLIELMDNLVQNAIRYNVENGKVLIQVSEENGQAVLVVKDTGIGIPKADQERVFERFYRVDKSRSRETGGTGLGLAIVKHIVELHDGKIELNSEVGKGTEIKVFL
ncbi:MAG: ATP-binding protein [Agathobacter sp.]